jgi:hypothetical protein
MHGLNGCKGWAGRPGRLASSVFATVFTAVWARWLSDRGGGVGFFDGLVQTVLDAGRAGVGMTREISIHWVPLGFGETVALALRLQCHN